jgi:hypothetical protein
LRNLARPAPPTLPHAPYVQQPPVSPRSVWMPTFSKRRTATPRPAVAARPSRRSSGSRSPPRSAYEPGTTSSSAARTRHLGSVRCWLSWSFRSGNDPSVLQLEQCEYLGCGRNHRRLPGCRGLLPPDAEVIQLAGAGTTESCRTLPSLRTFHRCRRPRGCRCRVGACHEQAYELERTPVGGRYRWFSRAKRHGGLAFLA